ncbi:DUF5324 family protein [Kitasatospora sp. NPDC002227]|uniref:DUF5324 family protein n=1 Tax=Kitasatospora sp. NPDC002227 TaxID=3154773 RepID=UPI00331B180B
MHDLQSGARVHNGRRTGRAAGRTEEEKPVTHSARETADRTKDALAPYATQARDTATQLALEARHRIGPAVEALGPRLEQAFAALPPQTQANTIKAVHRAQEAALAAKLSAARAAESTKGTVGPRISEARAVLAPAALTAQQRGSAALTALQGHVSAAEISALAARNAKKEQRRGKGTGLAVAGLLAIGAGLCAWQWWRRQSSPEWLVEPPASIGTAPVAEPTPVNGSAAASEEASAEEHPKPHPPKPGDDRPKPHDPRKPH